MGSVRNVNVVGSVAILAMLGVIVTSPAGATQVPITSKRLFNRIVNSGHPPVAGTAGTTGVTTGAASTSTPAPTGATGTTAVPPPEVTVIADEGWYELAARVAGSAQEEIDRIVSAQATGQQISPQQPTTTGTSGTTAASGTGGTTGVTAPSATGMSNQTTGAGTASTGGINPSDVLRILQPDLVNPKSGQGSTTGSATTGSSTSGGKATSSVAAHPSTTGGAAQVKPQALPPGEDPGDQIVTGMHSLDQEDILGFLNDIGSQYNVTIVADESIKAQPISPNMNFDGITVSEAITKVAKFEGAYVKEVSPGTFYVSKATPTSSMFHDFASSKIYIPHNQTAASIQALMSPAYKDYVQVDPAGNMISVTGAPELVARIMQDVVNADYAPRQFVVEALVVERTDENNDSFDFSWGWEHFALDSGLGASYSLATVADVAHLKALVTSHKANLKVYPRLTAFEGRESTLTVGQDVYFSLVSGNATLPFGQIQEIKTGVTLRFTGYVSDDGMITLNLSPEVSDAVFSGVGNNPTTNTRSAKTMVRVKSGETIAIGGLVQDTVDRLTNRIPILGQIPIFGELFSNHTNVHKKTEVIILITPHLTELGAGIIDSPADALVKPSSPGSPLKKGKG